MEPIEAAASELTTSPPRLAELLLEIGEIYRKNLLATANGRRYLDNTLKSIRESAAVDSRRFAPDATLLDRYSRAWNEYGEVGGSLYVGVESPASLEDAESIWNRCSQRCSHTLEDYRGKRQRYDENRHRPFRRPKQEPRIPEEFYVDLWAMKSVLEALPSLQQKYVDEATAESQRDLNLAFESEVRRRDAHTADEIDKRKTALDFGIAVLGRFGLAWSDALATLQQAPNERELALVRLGRFESVVPEAVLLEVPAMIEFPADRALAIDAPISRRDDAMSIVRSVVLRSLAAMPPGQLHLSIFDPVALGQSVADFLHLGDYDERLIDTKPRTSSREIEARLEEHVAHLEMVIGKYLRGQYTSIREYNRQAMEVAEPYRLLVVCDYPAQFTDRATELLLSLIENGARCGVHVIIHLDPEAAAQERIGLERILRRADRLTWRGQNLHIDLAGGPIGVDVVPDRCPPITFGRDSQPSSEAARFLAALGDRARSMEQRVVELDQCFELLARNSSVATASHLPVLKNGRGRIRLIDPESWWSGDSTTGATAILGRSGAQTVAPLYVSSTDIAGGALMVGLPRSGKTTALHAAILSLSITYSPEELELYLIDAKHGVEFNVYRDLPHARMVAINNEREFAVAVLVSLDREIAKRAELMKTRTPGRTNLQDYRLATGEALPRVVVVIDEFHELFEEDDRLGQEAFAAFSNIVRQGPFAGVHMILASQTLSSMPAMDRNTLTLLPARVAFACNESDGQVVMGDANQDVRFLSRAGEGLLNPNRGDPVYNVRFQGAFVPPEHRGSLIRQISVKATHAGWLRRPRVFDGDSLADRSQVVPSTFAEADEAPYRLRFVAGEPLTLEEYLPLTLRRTDGQNVLLVGPVDDDGVPEAGLLGVIESVLLAASRQTADTHVVDLVNDEGGPGSGEARRISLAELCGALKLSYHRRQGLGNLITDTADLVSERIALEEHRSSGRLLMVVGLQRASELDPDTCDDDSLVGKLQLIIKEGPEVGVHTILVADSLANLYRRLGTGILDDVVIRIVGRLPTDQDRQQLLDLYRPIDLRSNQLMLFDRDRDRRMKFRPYGPIIEGWLTLASFDAQFEGNA